MLIQGYNLPDSCPDNCIYKDHIYKYGQSAICRYCPVFCCMEVLDENNQPFRLLEPDQYRIDWLMEWIKLFENGTEPELRYELPPSSITTKSKLS